MRSARTVLPESGPGRLPDDASTSPNRVGLLADGTIPPADGTIPLTDGTVVLSRASWPAGHADELPVVAGFIISAFSPLAAVLADQCLGDYFGTPPGDLARGERTAIVLASATGDLPTAAAVARAVTNGRRVPPLLFYQSNPNAVAGYIAARWALAGPVLCTVSAADPLADAMGSATLLFQDGAALAALVIVANAYTDGDAEGIALLIGPAAWPPARHPPAIGMTHP